MWSSRANANQVGPDPADACKAKSASNMPVSTNRLLVGAATWLKMRFEAPGRRRCGRWSQGALMAPRRGMSITRKVEAAGLQPTSPPERRSLRPKRSSSTISAGAISPSPDVQRACRRRRAPCCAETDRPTMANAKPVDVDPLGPAAPWRTSHMRGLLAASRLAEGSAKPPFGPGRCAPLRSWPPQSSCLVNAGASALQEGVLVQCGPGRCRPVSVSRRIGRGRGRPTSKMRRTPTSSAAASRSASTPARSAIRENRVAKRAVPIKMGIKTMEAWTPVSVRPHPTTMVSCPEQPQTSGLFHDLLNRDRPRLALPTVISRSLIRQVQETAHRALYQRVRPN